MRISTRIGYQFGTLIVFLSLCIVVAIHPLYQVKTTLESAVQREMENSILIADLTIKQLETAITHRGFSIFYDKKIVKEELANQLNSKFTQNWIQLRGLNSNFESNQKYQDLNDMESSEKNSLDTFSNTYPLTIVRNKDIKMKYLPETVKTAQPPLLEGGAKTAEMLTKQLDDPVNKNEKNTGEDYIVQLTLLILMISLTISISVYLIRKLILELGDQPVNAQRLAYAISQGDFNTSIPKNHWFYQFDD